MSQFRVELTGCAIRDPCLLTVTSFAADSFLLIFSTKSWPDFKAGQL